MTTYVRSDDDDEVYAVEGFLASSINRDASAFRNKQVLKTTAGELSKITFNYPADSSFTIIKNEDKWMCDGLALDSAKVAQYLSGLRTINASGFTDKKPGSFTHTITMQDNQMQNIEVKAELQGEDAVFTSSQNQGTIFKEDKTRNFDKIFIPKSKLLP